MSEKKLRFRVGLFVLVGLVLLVGLIFLFTSLPNAFRTTKDRTYIVDFDDATGVTVGTPVRRSGVKIGEVTSVTLDDELGIVRVLLRIDKEYQIRKHEQVTLSTGLLSNDTTVDLLPREEEKGQTIDRSPVDPSQPLQGVRAANVNTLVARASEVVPPAQETLNEMRKTLQRLEKMQPLMEETLKEYRDLAKAGKETMPEIQKMVKNVNETIPEVKRVAENVNKSWPKVDGALDDISLTLTNWNRLGESLYVYYEINKERFQNVAKNLDASMQAMANILSGDNQRRIDETIRNTHQASERFDNLMKEGQQVMKQADITLKKADRTMDEANGVATDLRKITKPLGERSENIARNVDEGSARFNQVMGDVRELLKVIANSDGSLNRFINDPDLYNHIDNIAIMMGKVMPRLDRILADIEVFADKIARHPESIGIRGAVRPTSGLKDAPSQK